MPKVLLIGKSGRVDCLADALKRSRHLVELYAISEVNNPGLCDKADDVKVGRTDDIDLVRTYANEIRPDFAIIGPEEPLAAGVVDILRDELGIPCVGPSKSLAQIESSKSFTRKLLHNHNIPGNPAFKIFDSLEGLEFHLESLDSFVLKPDGLTGGKGVKVYREHLHTLDEAMEYCAFLFEKEHQPSVVVEEKLEGEEFSLQSFCDGFNVVDMVVAQDHKRSELGDKGPNTGGMGSYSCSNHLLPFLSPEHLAEASAINSAVARALREELNEEYKGILYGGFMITRDGVRVIEYNARFGDPEIMNVLPLLRTDFVDVCEAIISGTLDKLKISFDKKATVCKYLVPDGYPTEPVKNEIVDKQTVPDSTENLRVYFGAVNRKQDGELSLIGSRAIACVGIGDTLSEAERIAEEAVSQVKGPLRHRKDIGTSELVQSRVEHLEELMAGRSSSSLSTNVA